MAKGMEEKNKTKERPETVEASQINVGLNAESRSVKHRRGTLAT